MQITTENYYSAEADKIYMSVSQYKRWNSCPTAAHAQYVAGTYKPETSDAMALGSYFHFLFECDPEELIIDNPIPITKRQYYLDNHPELTLKTGKPSAPARQIEEMHERVKVDNFFMLFCTGEHERIFTFDLFGIPWKCRIDVIDFDKFGGFFCDIKTVKDFAPVWDEDLRLKLPFYIAMKYDVQLAVYQRGIEIATGFKLLPAIATVTKEKVPDFDIIDFTGEDADTHFAIKLNEVKAGVDQIQAMKAGELEIRRCNRCDYCKSTKRLTSTTMARF